MSELVILKPLQYDPNDVNIKLKMADGTIIAPYGYALGEQIWFESGAIFLSVQTCSSFLPGLVSNILTLDSDVVEIILESQDENMQTIFKLFNGMQGRISLSRCCFRSTEDIPTAVIKITL